MSTYEGHPNLRVARYPNGPGGIARHFRVQLRAIDGTDWHLHSTFLRRDLAEECVAFLHGHGHAVRLVDGNRCPTAA